MTEFWKQPRTVYPSMFRVLIGLVLLLDLIFSYPSGIFQFNTEFTHYNDAGNLISLLRENYAIFFAFYGIILILFITGIGRNFTALLVYIFNFLMLLVSPYTLNWGDIILKFTLLYFVFTDSFRYFSIGKNHINNNSLRNYMSGLAVWCIILHLFLIYLSNGIYKSLDSDWQNGLAPFYSFSQFRGFESGWFYAALSNQNFGKTLSYLIIAQQLSFIPLVIWKKTRYIAMFVGITIHIIMFFQFGLWKFETIMILLYGFLLNDDELKRMLPDKIKKYLV